MSAFHRLQDDCLFVSAAGSRRCGESKVLAPHPSSRDASWGIVEPPTSELLPPLNRAGDISEPGQVARRLDNAIISGRSRGGAQDAREARSTRRHRLSPARVWESFPESSQKLTRSRALATSSNTWCQCPVCARSGEGADYHCCLRPH